MSFTTTEIDKLKIIHEKIRSVLINYNNPEFGDCIIDDICEIVGLPPTTTYYDEN